jgi:arylsulfatase A
MEITLKGAFTGFLFTTTALLTFGQNAKHPNVIYILADDLGYGDLGCYGQKLIQTPEIDKMAEEGIKFTNHYSGSTVCAPSRCVLMTGLHSGHAYIRGNKILPLRDIDFTVAELFKESNYVTGCIGKWGLGENFTTGHPNNQGFDYFFGYLNQTHAHTYYTDFLIRNSDTVHLDGKTYSHDLFADDALKFITENKDTSFFLYVPFTIPHTKFQVPDLGIYADSSHWASNHRIQAAMISRMDGDVGRILDTLKQLGIDDNTLVIFTSDNGPHGQSGTLNFFDANGDLRGIKRDLYEGGVRVPFIAWWPGNVAPSSVSDHVSTFWDFLPTVGDILEVETPDSLDGLSMLPSILTGSQERKHEFLYWEFHEQNGKQAVRFGDWKGVRLNVFNNPNSPIELYNLANDLGEKTNVAELFPDIVNRIDFILKSERTYNQTFDFGYGFKSVQSISVFTARGVNVVAPGDTLQINYTVNPSTSADRRCTWELITENGVTAAFSAYGELIAGQTNGWVKLVAISVADTTITDTLSIEITNRPTVQLQKPTITNSTTVELMASIAGAWDSGNKAGFCYGFGSNPTVYDSVAVSVFNSGKISALIEKLPNDRAIYFRAFVITDADTLYSQQHMVTLFTIDEALLGKNVLLYLPFDNDFQDYSQRKLTLSVNGDPVLSDDAYKNRSGVFDGGDDFLQTPGAILNPAQSDFTFCAWIKPENNSTGRLILQQENGSGTGRSMLYLNGSSLSSFLGGKTFTSANSYQLNQWTHVALVGKKTQIQLFINAEPELAFDTPIESCVGKFNIGRHKVGQSDDKSWIGKMDEVYLLDTALTVTDIQKFMGFKLPVNKVEPNSKIGIYPNPASNFVRFTGLSSDALITVYSVGGAKMFEKWISKDNAALNVDDLKAGVYTVIIMQGQQMYRYKFVKY